MKGINPNPALDAYERVAVTPVSPARAPEATGGPETTGIPNQQATSVSISKTARQLASSIHQGQNPERIGELKQQVEQGALQIDPQQIAAKMLDSLG
jgi:flagellar biosynthesis anti-sigma factor FlgM